MYWQHVAVSIARARRVAIPACMAVAFALTATPPSAHAVAACVETLVPPGAAALKPADVLLALVTPRAGETIVAQPPADSIQLTVDYWGPGLIRRDGARTIDEYHLAYFLDEDATPYVGALLAIPQCNPRIVHAAQASIRFEDVRKGSHSLAVVLVGSNNVAVNPPVVARVTFMVR